MPNHFGEILKKYREGRGNSVQEFARLSKTPAGTISLVETGKRAPPATSVAAWADALGLTGIQREIFWLEAFRQCADVGDRRMRPYFRHVEERLATMAQNLWLLVQMCQKAKVQIPYGLIQKIKALCERP